MNVRYKLFCRITNSYSFGYEEFYLLGYNTGSAYYLIHAGFLLDLFFDPEDGSAILLRNVGCLSTDYTALYLRRQNSS
jgi:hypothetical protein